MKDVRKLTYTALLTAMAMAIPFLVVLKVQIPPFTATLTAHVPMFISMLLGPGAAIMVGLGSALGFFMNLGLVVGVRAFMHVFVGLAGAVLIKKGIPFNKVVVVTAPLHGLLEALVVVPFTGFNVYSILMIVGVGTILHHAVDGIISSALIKILETVNVYDSIKSE